jgi:hypothetical protein
MENKLALLAGLSIFWPGRKYFTRSHLGSGPGQVNCEQSIQLNGGRSELDSAYGEVKMVRLTFLVERTVQYKSA